MALEDAAVMTHVNACSQRLRRRRSRPRSTPLETMMTTTTTATCFLLVALAAVARTGTAGGALPNGTKDYEYYSPDGTNNNLNHPEWGSAATPRIRVAPPLHSYVDGISQPKTEEHGLPSAHRVLLDLFRVVEPHQNKPTSQMLLYFGQWIAHDITRSQEQRVEATGGGGGGGGAGEHRGDVPEAEAVETMPIPCGPGRKALAAASSSGGKSSTLVAPHPIPIGALGACNAASQHTPSLCPGASSGTTSPSDIAIAEQDGAGDAASSSAVPTDPLEGMVEPFIRMQRSGMMEASTSSSTADVGRSSSTHVPMPQSTTNFATSYIDLDHMYGPIIGGPPEDQYRAFGGGRMILDSHGMPPKDPTTGLYVFADPQTRLGPSLSALAIVFLRYHNLRAEAHASKDPALSDEELYWLARRDMTAAYQNMVEEKYIPTTLGETLDPYEGYKPEVDPSIDVFFSTASFRYGHSGLSGVIRMLDADYRPMPQDPLLLRDAFDHTESVLGSSEDDSATAGVLRGLAAEPAKAADASFVDDVAFYTKRMAEMNIQRGRDAGLPSYNEAREWFGLGKAETFVELAEGNQQLAASLNSLYPSVDDVDAFVGGLLEPNKNLLGPLVTASMKEQFTRLRDGDRFWYKSLLTEKEIAALPTLTEMIRMTFGEESMRYYPSDSFAAVDQLAVASSGQTSALHEDAHLVLLEGGSFNASWDFTQSVNKTRNIELTLRVNEVIDGGYVGIGFGSQSMVGAEMWYCQTTRDAEVSSRCSKSDQEAQFPTKPVAFTCCVANVGSHVVPRCTEDGHALEIVDSCLSPAESFVTLRAPLCKLNADGSKCFQLQQGEVDFIAAYSPSLIGPHGFSRRTMGRIDLNTGWGAASSSDSANAGLFALHGGLMIVCWFVLVPAAIWIVRYCKGKAWRLVAHIALVGVSGSLVFAVATMALVSVEGTSFGTVGGGSVFSKHKIVGLCVVAFVAFMLVTGEARRTREINKVIKTTAMDRIVLLAHRCGGFTLLGMAWWNCYTGLEKMAAYENDAVEITWLSTHTTTSDMQFFTIFRQYIFFPWITAICIIFVMTEIRHRRTIGAKHLKRVAAVRRGSLSLWGSVADGKGLQEMSIENFLQLTRQGSPLTIVDGLVLDIGAFSEYHPGGSRILRFAIGSDISEHIIGEKDVDGVRHVHSPTALKTLRTLIKARLIVPENNPQLGQWFGHLGGASGEMAPSHKRRLSQRGVNLLVFRDATIVDADFITSEKSISAKPVIRMRLALKKEQMDALRGTPVPSTTFVFRGKDAFGGTIERPYTPVKCYSRDEVTSDQDLVTSSVDGSTLPTTYNTRSSRKEAARREEVIYEFIINLVPNGLMSTFLNSKKKNSHIMVQGPLANEVVIDKIYDDNNQKREIVLIAAGTGVAPMLQMIDHFLDERETSGLEPPTASNVKPRVFLCWIVYCPALSFEEATELRERTQKFGANFRYFIVYANDTTERLLNKIKPTSDGGPVKVSNRRMSLTKTFSAPGETPKTAGRRMSLTRGSVSLQKVETNAHGDAAPGSGRRARRKSFKATDLESEVHNEPHTQLPSKLSCRASLSANGDSKPLSLRQRRASLTSMGNSGGGLIQTSTSSLRERRASLTMNLSNVLSAAKSSNAPPSKPIASDYDSDDSSLFSDSDTDEDESALVTESFDSPAARRQFQALYRAKGRFDNDLIAKLLPMATGRHFDSPTYGEAGEEDDETLRKTRISVTYRDTVVAICGRPQFDDNCMDILLSLGLDEDQIITFGAGNVPLGQVIPSSYYSSSLAHTAHI